MPNKQIWWLSIDNIVHLGTLFNYKKTIYIALESFLFLKFLQIVHFLQYQCPPHSMSDFLLHSINYSFLFTTVIFSRLLAKSLSAI